MPEGLPEGNPRPAQQAPLLCQRCGKPVGRYSIGGIFLDGGSYIVRHDRPQHLNACMITEEQHLPDGTTLVTSRFLPFDPVGIDGDTEIYL